LGRSDNLNWIYVWFAVIILTAVLEAATVGLTSIWFSLGALVALIAATVGLPVWVQVVLFLLVSVICLIYTRPLVKNVLKLKSEPTNADRVIGCDAVVIDNIDNMEGKGLVKVKGQAWSARSEDDSAIRRGEQVNVKRIDGVKLIVAKK
jgi:membrane protein implicated in regulation of membrane protease activity